MITQQKQPNGSPSIQYPNLNAAIGSLLGPSLIEREFVGPIIPGTLVPRSRATSQTIPPSTSEPILPSWGLVDTTIEINDTKSDDATYYPIIVNMNLSSAKKLVYKPIINIPITEGTWPSVNVLIKPPEGYLAFPNIKAGFDAQTPPPQDIFFPPVATNSTNPTNQTNQTNPGGGSGKRTRKNKKSKTSNRKKHQSMRKRRRA